MFFYFYFLGMAFLTIISFAYRVAFLNIYQADFTALSFNQKLYALFWGIKYDLTAAVILTLFVIGLTYFGLRLTKIRKIWKWLFVIAIFILCGVMASDIMYYANAGHHVSYEASDFGTDFFSLLSTAIRQYTWLTILSLIVPMVMSFIFIKLLKLKTWNNKTNFSIFKLEIPFVIVILLSIIILRGGVRGVPQNPQNAFQIGDGKQAVIAMSGGYSTLYYMMTAKKGIKMYNLPQFDKATKKRILSELYPKYDSQVSVTGLKKVNVIVFMLESWPAMYMKTYGYDKTVTPEFDALNLKSLRAEGMIAGGHRTSEGIFATFCSYQNPLGRSVAETQLEYYKYRCLPQILVDQGWSTAYYEGTNKETSGVGQLAQAIGFQYNYGKKDIKKHQYPENSWGAQDPDQYQFILENIQTLKQPFMIGINTTTSHDDILPPSIKPEFGMDTHLNKTLSVLHFSDKAMGDFIRAYKKLKNVGPTLFIIEADHTAGLVGVSNTQQYFIPFAMFSSEGDIPAKKMNRYVAQSDIAPTILDYLGGYASWFTGKSMLQHDHVPYFADYYTNNSLGWIMDNHLTEINLQTGQLKCYDKKNLIAQKQETACTDEDQKRKEQAMVFTSHSQRLLFDGKTTQFFDVLGR